MAGVDAAVDDCVALGALLGVLGACVCPWIKRGFVPTEERRPQEHHEQFPFEVPRVIGSGAS
jgi:hypothetical protein